MSNKDNQKVNNGVYVVQYKKGIATQSFIPLEEVIYKDQPLGKYLGSLEKEILSLKKKLVNLNNILAKQQEATKKSFDIVLEKVNDGVL